VSSHVLPEVQRICDRVGFVREGVLVACEEVASLTGRAVRELEVVFGEPVPLEALGQIPEVSNLARDGRNANQVRFTVTGPIDRVIKTLGSYRVSDLRSREPDLEDVFLTFYSGDETPREARS
jgi:ABC-2 type transport system ATP-binding protein